jgi:hypothetical protein
LARPRGEVAERLSVSYPNTHLKDLVLGLRTKKKLERVIREQRVIYLIRSSGCLHAANCFSWDRPGPVKPSPLPHSLANSAFPFRR